MSALRARHVGVCRRQSGRPGYSPPVHVLSLQRRPCVHTGRRAPTGLASANILFCGGKNIRATPVKNLQGMLSVDEDESWDFVDALEVAGMPAPKSRTVYEVSWGEVESGRVLGSCTDAKGGNVKECLRKYRKVSHA